MPSALDKPRVIVDFETRSELSVMDCGAWPYSEHHSTKILCLGYKLPGQQTKVWKAFDNEPFPVDLLEAIANGYAFEAHNAQFERAIWLNILEPQYGVPMPTYWTDTLASCAYKGLPLSLDKVGAVFDMEEKKDSGGKTLLNKLSVPQRYLKAELKQLQAEGYDTDKDKLPIKWNNSPDLMNELYKYCQQDVEAEHELSGIVGDLPLPEYRLWILDQRINQRGISLDTNLVSNIVSLAKGFVEQLTERLQEITEGEVTKHTQGARILAWLLNKHKIELLNLQAETVEISIDRLKKDIKLGLYEEEDIRPVIEVLEIRLELNKSSLSKAVKAMMSVCQDGKLRGQLQYHGAQTGRWAGRGVQPQNMPRGCLERFCDEFDLPPDEMMEKLVDDIDWAATLGIEYLTHVYGSASDALVTALRGIFVASDGRILRVADFAAIEAVALAWVAGEEWKIKAFELINRGEKFNGADDIYCATASKMFNRVVTKKDNKSERQTGKTCELAFGYQGGVGAWRNFDSSDKYTDEEVDQFKKQWRDKHPAIVSFWQGVENAAIRAVASGEPNHYKSVTYDIEIDSANNKWLVCILPNKRKIWYFNPKLVETRIWFTDSETGDRGFVDKLAIEYEGKDSKKSGAWGKIRTYGGMLTENIVQAISRDIMVEGIVRVEKAGYPIILSVHDELIADVIDTHGSQEEFESLMSGPNPPWLDGCPVGVSGWSGKRYRKD